MPCIGYAGEPSALCVPPHALQIGSQLSVSSPCSADGVTGQVSASRCPSSPCPRYAVQMAPQPSVPFQMFCRWSHRSGLSSPYPSYTLQIGPQPSVPLPMLCRSALCTSRYALQIGPKPSVPLVCRLALCNLSMLYPFLYSAD
jgi:hypothetical protein